MRTKIVVRFFEHEKVHRWEFDNIDEANNIFNDLRKRDTVKMADLEVETVTTLKAFNC